MAKITPEIKSQISLMNAEGKSANEIATDIKRKYNIAIGKTAIVKHVRVSREERKEIAKGIAEQYVSESIPSDLEIMGDAIQRLNDIANDKSIKVQHQINANVALLKAVETRLKISGVGLEGNKEFIIKIDMSSDDEMQEIEEYIPELEVIHYDDDE